jgi:hypothetical protein
MMTKLTMSLEQMQDIRAAKTKPPIITVRARHGGRLPSFATLATIENNASRSRPPMNTAMRKTVSEARVALILAHVRSNPGVTTPQVAAALNVGPDIARVGLVQLETQGLIVRGAKAKTGAPWTAVQE